MHLSLYCETKKLKWIPPLFPKWNIGNEKKKNLFDFFKKDFSKVVHFFVEEVDFYKKISFVFGELRKKEFFHSFKKMHIFSFQKKAIRIYTLCFFFKEKKFKRNQLLKTKKRIL